MKRVIIIDMPKSDLNIEEERGRVSVSVAVAVYQGIASEGAKHFQKIRTIQ